MKVSDIEKDVHANLFKSVSSRFEKFTPPQELAVKNGLFEGENMVVSSPTASGKTLVAEMACVNNILNGKGKAVYIVPLKSLASEKFRDFKKYYDIKTAVSVGDFDSSDGWLEKYDLIITTSEKMDSLLRHRANWVSKLSTIVVDEVHMMTDPHRGPTLEILITRLRRVAPEAQTVALSATVSNDSEVAEWFDAKLVQSDYRPVELHQGVYCRGEIDFGSKSSPVFVSLNRVESEITEDTLQKKKQIMFFLMSRRYTESLAREQRKVTKRHLSEEDKESLNRSANEILEVLEIPTSQCEKLAQSVRDGSAFHHAGLLSKQRELIEDAFRSKRIKCICATPTLSMGVNLPSFRVVVRDLKRYSAGSLDWIPTLEYHQLAGRAGRPDYDEYGEAITLARSENEKEEIFDRFIKAESEAVYSKLSSEPVLRTHVLSLICDTTVRNSDELLEFFSETFWAHQYGRMEDLEEILSRIVDLLFDWEFIERVEGKLIPTKLGKRVSELYLDPASANYLIQNLRKLPGAQTNPITFLHLICRTSEIRKLRLRASDFAGLQKDIAKVGHYLLEPEPSPFDYEYDEYLRALRTATMLLSWAEEEHEDMIFKNYAVPPGDLRSQLFNVDWLLYSCTELGSLIKTPRSEMIKLRTRMKHGVREELLDLVSLRHIGRVRARMLYTQKIRSKDDVGSAQFEKLQAILGSRIAQKIKDQVETS
jgi:helicase